MAVKKKRLRDSPRALPPQPTAAVADDIVVRLATLASELDGASAAAEAIAHKVREDLIAEETRYVVEPCLRPPLKKP